MSNTKNRKKLRINSVKVQDCVNYARSLPSKSIDVIYSDILFGTGRDFIDYKDPKFKTLSELKEFYLPFFLEAHRCLKITGTIYIHCDQNLSHYIKYLLDIVFGKWNFRNEIIWHYNSAPRKKKDFGKRHDVILRYSKSNLYLFNNKSKYIRVPYSLSAPRGYEKEKYYNPLGKVLGSVWNIPIIGQNDKKNRVGYATQKPIQLMYPIISSSCPPKGCVADFFCGSGTFLVAAAKLGRNYVGCDISSKAIAITKRRLNKLI